MGYFKTNDEKVMQARALYVEQCRRVQREGERFAERFGCARPVCAGDLSGRMFVGLAFRHAPDPALWQEVGRPGVYEPRDEVPDDVTPERRAAVGEALGALRQTWASERPYFQADLGLLKGRLGLHGADQAFGMRFHYVDGVDGYFYFHAKAHAGTHCIEISADEFAAAELAAVKRQGRRHDARERARIL